MKTSRMIQIAAICTLTTSFGCSESSFTSSGGTRKFEDPKNASPRQGQADSGGGSDLDSSEDTGNGRPGVDAFDSDIAEDSSNITTIAFDDCLKIKAENYNILLIFDNSGSQTQTDPDAVRRDGALYFVDQFADYARRNPQTIVRFGVLSFNHGSNQISDQWLQMSDVQVDQIKQQITTATTRPNGGTAYSPVLRDAERFYGLLNDGDRRIKNYTVFLTDGLPNASDLGTILGGAIGFGRVEKMTDIPIALNALVTNHDVAMIAIATGPDIPPQGESITQDLAKPTVGTSDPKHVGIYRRAKTPEELKEVWKGLFATIGQCD